MNFVNNKIDTSLKERASSAINRFTELKQIYLSPNILDNTLLASILFQQEGVMEEYLTQLDRILWSCLDYPGRARAMVANILTGIIMKIETEGTPVEVRIPFDSRGDEIKAGADPQEIRGYFINRLTLISPQKREILFTRIEHPVGGNERIIFENTPLDSDIFTGKELEILISLARSTVVMHRDTLGLSNDTCTHT